jgi:hypothetical protein
MGKEGDDASHQGRNEAIWRMESMKRRRDGMRRKGTKGDKEHDRKQGGDADGEQDGDVEDIKMKDGCAGKALRQGIRRGRPEEDQGRRSQ